jgi:hypothetical protein
VLTSAQTFLLYVTTLKFAILTWLFTLIIGFPGRLLSRLPRQEPAARDRPVSGLHDPVLDLEHHPDDFLDSAARERKGWSTRRCSASA